MKKQLFLLAGGGLLALASCQQESTGGYTQEQVDSIVNARVAEQMIALQASNDSMINAVAQMKADSIIAAMKGGSSVTTKTHTSTTRTTTVNNGGGSSKTIPPKTVESGGLKSQSDQNRVNDKTSVQGGGLKSQSDQNKTNNTHKVESGGLKSQSDQNRK